MRTLILDAATSAGRAAHVAAASALVRAGDWLYVVGDDELHLAAFAAIDHAAPGHTLRLFPGTLPDGKKARKKAKPDLEALVRIDDTLLAIPSGSRPNRTLGARLLVDAAGRALGRASLVDFSLLFAALESDYRIRSLNLEGAVVQGEFLRLFQRGNAKGADNAVIDLDLKTVAASLDERWTIEPNAIRAVTVYRLGKLDGVPLSFTDAATVAPDLVAFVAAAEATDDPYEDAPVAGSIVGLIRGVPGAAGELEALHGIDRVVKVEGLAVQWQESGRSLQVLMVTDADDASAPALLLSGVLNLS